jgi:hypothetical protein
LKIPIYPAFNVDVTENDTESFITNTIACRITTRVPHEMWEEFCERLGILAELPSYLKKELPSG